MSRFAPGDPVEWVSRSGIRREGEILEQLPRGQWLVRPDGSAVDQAVDAADLSRRGEGRAEEAVTVPVKVVGFPTRPRVAGNCMQEPAGAGDRRQAQAIVYSPPPEPAAPRSHSVVRAEGPSATPPPAAHHPKNPAAVALGRLGGRKGGLARAAKLTPEQRSAIARRAAEARWGARKSGNPQALHSHSGSPRVEEAAPARSHSFPIPPGKNPVTTRPKPGRRRSDDGTRPGSHLRHYLVLRRMGADPLAARVSIIELMLDAGRSLRSIDRHGERLRNIFDRAEELLSTRRRRAEATA